MLFLWWFSIIDFIMNKKVKFLLIILGIMVFAWYSYVGIVKYINWRWYEGMKKEAVKFEKELADKEAMIANDTYGGKTPQETLVLFIDAVEKGDYELASKYFVVEKQGEWEENLSKVKNLDFLIDDLIEIKENLFFVPQNNFSITNSYIVTDPILVTFIKYPSNLWKIDEI